MHKAADNFPHSCLRHFRLLTGDVQNPLFEGLNLFNLFKGLLVQFLKAAVESVVVSVLEHHVGEFVSVDVCVYQVVFLVNHLTEFVIHFF